MEKVSAVAINGNVRMARSTSKRRKYRYKMKFGYVSPVQLFHAENSNRVRCYPHFVPISETLAITAWD